MDRGARGRAPAPPPSRAAGDGPLRGVGERSPVAIDDRTPPGEAAWRGNRPSTGAGDRPPPSKPRTRPRLSEVYAASSVGRSTCGGARSARRPASRWRGRYCATPWRRRRALEPASILSAPRDLASARTGRARPDLGDNRIPTSRAGSARRRRRAGRPPARLRALAAVDRRPTPPRQDCPTRDAHAPWDDTSISAWSPARCADLETAARLARRPAPSELAESSTRGSRRGIWVDAWTSTPAPPRESGRRRILHDERVAPTPRPAGQLLDIASSGSNTTC